MAGAGQPNPSIVQLLSKIDELEQWAGQVRSLLNLVQPSLIPLLVPIAQAGLALRAELNAIQQRATAGPQAAPPAPAPPPGT
jgi:hypothetical protein